MRPSISPSQRRGSCCVFRLSPLNSDSTSHLSALSTFSNTASPHFSLSPSPASRYLISQSCASPMNGSRVRTRRMTVRKVEGGGRVATSGDGIQGRRWNSKVWTETEQELDSLQADVRPRRQAQHRASQSHFNVSVIEPPTDPEPDSRIYLAYSPDKPESKPVTSSPKVYVNLPKLPFGKHKSYNDESNIRELIVSKRWKAWRREGRRKLKRREEAVNSTMC